MPYLHKWMRTAAKADFSTDSRVRDNKGITAHRDLEHNPFLKELRRENPSLIQFIESISQPTNTAACWLYALANLAALATTGTTYQRQRKTGTLGQELCSALKKRVRHHEKNKKTEEALPSASEISTVVPLQLQTEDRKITAETTKISSMSKPAQEPIEIKTGQTKEKVASHNPLSPKNEIQERRTGKNTKELEYEANRSLFFKAVKPIEQPNKSNLKIGLGLLASGTGLIGLGFLLSPIALGSLFSPIISLPLSITLMALGSILALSGIIILAKQALTQNKSVNEAPEYDEQLMPSGLNL